MSFDYSTIPDGYYDYILKGPEGIRKFWHFHKFESVIRYIPESHKGQGKNILDVGCFAGSFLGGIPESVFSEQLGVDILDNQIQYAQKQYGTSFRKFETYTHKIEIETRFDVITLIEVIEHLGENEIYNLFSQLLGLLKPGGIIIVTTPNYLSTWPVLEILLNHFSDVRYEEQHLTKFNYINFESKLHKLTRELKMECQAKTTSHFLSPFLAGISYKFAEYSATKIKASDWKNPFGNIILSRWSKA